MIKLVRVRFLTEHTVNNHSYKLGQVQKFQEGTAKKLVDKKFAEYVDGAEKEKQWAEISAPKSQDMPEIVDGNEFVAEQEGGLTEAKPKKKKKKKIL